MAGGSELNSSKIPGSLNHNQVKNLIIACLVYYILLISCSSLWSRLAAANQATVCAKSKDLQSMLLLATFQMDPNDMAPVTPAINSRYGIEFVVFDGGRGQTNMFVVDCPASNFCEGEMNWIKFQVTFPFTVDTSCFMLNFRLEGIV